MNVTYEELEWVNFVLNVSTLLFVAVGVRLFFHAINKRNAENDSLRESLRHKDELLQIKEERIKMYEKAERRRNGP